MAGLIFTFSYNNPKRKLRLRPKQFTDGANVFRIEFIRDLGIDDCEDLFAEYHLR